MGTISHKQWTPEFEDIADKYKLDIDGPWNTAQMHHQGRHPNEYHEWMLAAFDRADKFAKGNQQKFLGFLEPYFQAVRENPEVLMRRFWQD
jgi:hypothetical protein